MSLICAGRLEDVSPRQAKLVEWEGHEFAVFNVDGQFYALDNLCPHKEAPLIDGKTVFENGRFWVTCPWHRFLFDPRTGECDRTGFDTRAYPVTVYAGNLFIQI